MGRSRLSSSAFNTDQVMIQAGSQSMAGPVRVGGIRGKPRSAYVTPSLISGPSASSVRTAVAEPPNSQKPFVPTVTLAHRTVPTAAEVSSEPLSDIDTSFSPPVEISQSRRGPVVDALKSVNSVKKMTDLEKFRTQGFKTRTEGKGKNFVFIIDKSESMLQDNKLEGATQALERTLEKLEEGEKYFIYFFSDNTLGMDEGRMMEATSVNISTTKLWVSSMSPSGFTNPREALTDAFDKLKPTTIWLLSDGKFSSFKHVEIGNKTRLVGLPSVLQMIRKLNGPRNVRINTIGFAARENQVDASLKDIAKENSGTYEFIQTGEK